MGQPVSDLTGQVRVHRGCFGTAMTERVLNQTQMNAQFHQVRGIRVAKAVNVRAFGNARFIPGMVEGALQARAGDWTIQLFQMRRREKPLGGAVRFPKLAQPVERGFRQRDKAVPSPLP